MKDLSVFINEKLKLSDVKHIDKRFKPFSKVKQGDKGITYSGEEATVIDKGTVEEMKKYDEFGVFDNLLQAGMITKDDDAVAIEINDDNSRGSTYSVSTYSVWTYGEDGFLAYK